MVSEAGEVLFTYSVEWHKSDVVWASRWDIYLAMSDVQIHWFSIINSVVVVFFLSGGMFVFARPNMLIFCRRNAYLLFKELSVTLKKKAELFL